MSNIEFICNIKPNSYALEHPLGLRITLNDEIIYNKEFIDTEERYSYTMPDDKNQWQLEFELYNKTDSHTLLDDQGNVVSSAEIKISEMSFDGISLDNLTTNIITYTHNLNGYGNSRTESFLGTMGCNGAVTLKFTTPIYFWLLNHM